MTWEFFTGVAEKVAGSHANREHTVEIDAPGHRGRYLSLSRWRAVGHQRDSFTFQCRAPVVHSHLGHSTLPTSRLARTREVLPLQPPFCSLHFYAAHDRLRREID